MAFPENAGATFGTDDRVIGVLKHSHAIAHADAQGAARAAFAKDHANHRSSQPRHFIHRAGNHLGLAAFLVFIRELLDRSLRHPARVRQLLGIPVLEAIGEQAEPLGEAAPPGSFKEALRDFEHKFLADALARHNSNITHAAQMLHMERAQLSRKLKALGLSPGE